MDEAKQRIQKWIKNYNIYTWLDLSHLNLTELPDIPPNCVKLDCSHNKLISLPELPNCEKLDCSCNKLTKLPRLPKIDFLICSNNKIVYLEDIPQPSIYMFLGTFFCTDNDFLYISPKIYRQHRNLNLDKRTTNYPLFALKIQKAFRIYKKGGVFKELQKIYIKNMAMLISQYV